MTYLLQVSTCWILFYGIYLLFLRKETFFSINRYYLLGTLVLGLLIPYFGAFMPANEASVEVYQVMAQFSTMEITPQPYVEKAESIFTWTNLLWSIYAFGGLVVFSRFLYGLSRIFNIYKDADISQQSNYTLVKSNKYHLPFSFFHFIFISKQLPLNDQVEKILKHEELHANQWHSIDIVFTELLQVFFWFNPILIFYKNALRHSHEYLADAYVTQDHNKNSYGQLLLQQSTSGLEVALANQFFHSQIKKRITMMYKEKSKRSAMLKYLAAIPVLVAMLIIFSSNQKPNPTDFDILVLDKEHIRIFVSKNGAYSIESTPVSLDEIEVILSNDDPKTNSIQVVSIGKKQKEKAKTLLELAKKHGIKTQDSEYNIEPIYFGGRKIIEKNWIPFYHKYKSIEGKIFVKAEANPNGDIVYVEINKEKTTIENKVILKDALKTAKGFKIEKGDKSTFGEISFNLNKTTPHQGHLFDTDNENFKFDNEINLGEQVPEGSVEVRIKDQILIENKDFSIDYTNGKLTLGKSYIGEEPVNVTFRENQGDPIFKVVEEMPRFPGCEDMKGTAKEKENCAKEKMLKFIYSNLKYPSEARDAGVEGVCVIQFIIEKDGSIKEATIVRDIGAGCGAETLNVINKFPNWIPGKQKGKVVRVKYTLPVKFKLEGGAPLQKKAKDEKVVVVGFGEPDQKAKKENLKIDQINEPMKDIFKVVQEMPRFAGCEEIEGTIEEKEECSKHEMLKYVYTNIRYPKEARTKGIDGMSVISMIIEKDGSVSNVSTLRDPGAGTGDEAARVVKGMPKWIPGKQNGELVRVQYTLPVKFKLEGDKSTDIKDVLKGKTSGVNISNGEKSNIVLKTSDKTGPQPLYVIDGIINSQNSLEQINPNDIKAIQVLKGEKANEKYGDKGLNGVIEITTKKVKSSTKYLIDGQLFGEDFYNSIEKSHINKEGPASKEEKFMRGIEGELIKVNMLAGYGFNSAYFPGTNTEEGTSKALMTYVGNNIEYPRSAIDNNIEGVVTVRYTVKADGTLTNFQIGKSLGWGLDQAVLDMMEKLAEEKGLWRAAYLDRRSVSSSMILPVKFKLQASHKEKAKTRKLSPMDFSVSPNPSNGQFNIEYQLEEDLPATLVFYSSTGQVIKKMTNLPARNNVAVDLSDQNTSLIYVTLEQQGKVKTIKATLQN